MEEAYKKAFRAGAVSLPDMCKPEESRMSEKPPLLAMLLVPFILLYIKILDLFNWLMQMDDVIHHSNYKAPKNKKHNDKKTRDTITK
tara:strand:- start:301 stop:561 length:261 start_codon:yes stop_codon:yes gene_type:complete